MPHNVAFSGLGMKLCARLDFLQVLLTSQGYISTLRITEPCNWYHDLTCELVSIYACVTDTPLALRALKSSEEVKLPWLNLG
jgi:hypothetical protein